MAVISAVALCGCSKEHGLKKQILGTWELYFSEAYRSDGTYFTEEMDGTGEYTLLVFNKDGSYILEDKESNIRRIEGTYEITESLLKLTDTKCVSINNDGTEETIYYDGIYTEEYEFHFEGDDVLILTDNYSFGDVNIIDNAYYRRR